MKKRIFVLLLTALLIVIPVACGGASVPMASSPGDNTPSSSAASLEQPVPPAETPEKPSAEPEETPPLPAKPEIDPADHIFPDLEIFFGGKADDNRSVDARGWKYSFEKLRPYDQLEVVKAELLALLQEPCWQLELVDKETTVYESGDINPVDTFYFKYTGTAELTMIRDVIGTRSENVIVTFYHVPVHGYYNVSLWRSPELEVVDPGRQISAETDAIDPASKLLPDIFAFLYHDRSAKTSGTHGRESSCNGSHPGASFEGVRGELLALLEEEQYQLELVDSWINPHYSNIEMHDYFYTYTGTAGGFELLTDKYGEKRFHVMLRVTYYPEYDYFKLSMTYNRAFDVVDPGKRTVWDIEHDGKGGPLTDPPESAGSGSDFWEKCSACHGSGKCTHCSGKGEVKKFQAGLGWVELDCTLCNRGKCRHCSGTGRD